MHYTLLMRIKGYIIGYNKLFFCYIDVNVTHLET